MGWPVVALLGLVTLALSTTAYRVPEYELIAPDQKHIPDEDVPTFQRNSVESLPQTAPIRRENDEYGSHSLPLRTAVEALPDFIGSKSQPLRDAVERIPEKLGMRIPLRDAVEHRTAPFFGGLSHDSLWLEQLSPPTIRRNNQKYAPKIVCHFDSGAFYRSEPFSLTPRGIPSGKCTHLVYRAAILDPQDLTLIPRNPEYDIAKGGYNAALALRKKDPSLSVLISIILPNHGRLFAQSMARGFSREEFAQSIIAFLEKYEFDGIEIDWESASNEQLRLLMSSIHDPLSSRGFTIALAVRPNNPPDRNLASMTDLLFLQAWRAPKGQFASHPAPLNFAISVAKRWIDVRVEPAKIILGAPLFGVSYTLKFSNATDEGAPINGPGMQGIYTNRIGALAYYEICEKLEDRWTYGRDEEGAYIKHGDQWIGYDDPLTIKLKAAYVKSVGLGGMSFSSVDLDDFVGLCGEPWPMINAAIQTFRQQEVSQMDCLTEGRIYKDPSNCAGYLACENGKFYQRDCGFGRFFNVAVSRCVKANPEVCKVGWTSKDYSLTENALKSAIRNEDKRSEKLRIEHKGPRVVCYITSWALYRKGDGKFVPEQLDTRLCTDVIYAFAGLNPETLQIQPFDPWADIENNLYVRATSIQGPRVLLGLGGWTDSAGDKYSRLINSPIARKQFVTSTVDFLRKFGFDGLSFEWHYPTCWQSHCGKGPKSDRPNLTKFLQELRREFDASEPKLTLAVSVSAYKEIIDVGYDFPEISEAVQFISVMSYDYHGAWERQAGHLAPLYGSPDDNNPYYNVNFTMNYIASLGAKRSKLLVGIPFYGQTYQLIRDEWYNLGEPVSGAGKPGEFTRQPGMLAYYEICDRVKRQNWQVERGPSAHNKEQMVVYDDPKSVDLKGRWIMENGFGGATAWTVDLDDFSNRCCQGTFPLLKRLNYALGGRIPRPDSDLVQESENCERPPEPVTPLAPTLTTHSDANDGQPNPTRPMATSTTSKATTWPTWTEKSTTGNPAWSWSSTIKSTTTTSPTTTRWTEFTTTSTTPETDSFSMTGTSCNSGEHVADPIDCSSYFRCVLGELKREQCAPGLHWDGSQGRCDWPGRAKCQGSSMTTEKPRPTIIAQKPMITTSWNPPSTAKPTAKPTSKPMEIQTKDCEHGQYYAYPNSCTNFRICVNGNLVTQQCGPGLNWNQEKNMCDWAFKNPCKTKMSAALMMDDQETQKEECIPGSFSGVPGDCESYNACLWGRHEKFQCAPGLHFNPSSHICDWPARAKCKDKKVEEPPPSIPIDEKPIPATTQKPLKPMTIATTQKPLKPMTIVTTQKPWSEVTTQKPLPPSKIDPSKVSPLSGYYKVVCYFTNWAWYRRGIGRYLPEHIDHTLCTHIVYGFAVLDYSNLVIKAHDSWADFDNRFYERVVAYKQRGLKVSLALGGWNDSAGDKYSRLVNSPSSRRKFIEHALKFVEKYGFDGLDLDWEYPVCWQVDCRKGPKSDKEGFALLLQELSAVFKPRGLLLSSAVSPSKTVIDEGYDVPALAKYLDWIAVMTYDFHGQWDKKTGHVAPLFYHKDDEFYFFNANYTINYWISKGTPPRSIVMGMPLYGQAFSLNDPSAGTGLNSPASAGTAGEFTKAAGFLAYYEICDRVRNRGWKVVQDPQRRMGPYAYKGNQWVSFDDADMIRQKAQFVRDMGLGGGMVWALDLDDFRGRCDDGPHPLMHTLQQVLAEPPNKHDRPIKPPAVGQELQWKLPKAPSMSATQMLDKVMDQKDEYKVVCYFTNWAWYRQEGGRYVPEDIDGDLCTHIVYGFAVLDGTTLTIKTHDSWADIDNKFYDRVVAYKSKGIKVSLAIGGWNDSAGDKYSRLANSAAARARFITHVVQFIEKYGFEGLDLDWEYPVCWQVDCNKGPASDKAAFSLLVKELSEVLKPKGLLLSSAVSPSKRVISEGYDVPTLAKYLDWIAVMTYDFHGQWDKKTGHVAPFYEHPLDWEPTFNANFSINYWIERGAPPKKLVMGAPLYGQSFSLAERSERGLNSPTYGGGEAGDATRARGFLAYYEICERTLRKGWTVVQDPERRIGPYAYSGDQWVSFDDARQIRLKSEYIKQMGLGGGMVWALDLDDFKNRCQCEPMPLLRTMNRVLRNYPESPDCQVTGSSSETPPTPTANPIHHPINEASTTIPSSPSTSAPENHPDLTDTIAIDAGPQPPTIPPIGECTGGKIFIPHKNDCSKYLICNFGELSEQSCPTGLHWNEDRCDWPENSKCNKKIKPDESINIVESGEKPPQQHPTATPATIVQQTTSSHVEHLIDGTQDRSGTKLVCYFTNWAWYRPGNGKYLPENIDPKLCTHIVYGFTVLDSEQLVIKMHDSWADVDNDFYGRVTAYRAKGIKVLLALGGWNDSLGDKYSRLVNNPSARKKFINNALMFVEKYGFDGLDLDWEYPVCWQVDCNRGPPSDKESFGALVRELSHEFKPRNLLLSAAVSPSKRVIDKGYDVPTLGKYLDWIAVMTYDFHGHWEKKTGHVAPLYYYPGDEFDYFNANFSMRYWMEKGAPASKLVMGVPLYGQSFSLSDTSSRGLQAQASGPGEAGQFTRAGGFLAFYEICDKVKNGGWQVTKDPEGRIGPYATRGNQWVGYDDVTNIARKAAFIRQLGIAGGMIWALDLDDFNNDCGCGKYPLLNALNSGLRGQRFVGNDCT